MKITILQQLRDYLGIKKPEYSSLEGYLQFFIYGFAVSGGMILIGMYVYPELKNAVLEHFIRGSDDLYMVNFFGGMIPAMFVGLIVAGLGAEKLILKPITCIIAKFTGSIKEELFPQITSNGVPVPPMGIAVTLVVLSLISLFPGSFAYARVDNSGVGIAQLGFYENYYAYDQVQEILHVTHKTDSKTGKITRENGRYVLLFKDGSALDTRWFMWGSPFHYRELEVVLNNEFTTTVSEKSGVVITTIPLLPGDVNTFFGTHSRNP